MVDYVWVRRVTRKPLRGFLANRLRELRMERSLSQGELALHANVSTAAVSAWELGRSVPSADKLLAVVQALDRAGHRLGLPPISMADLISVPNEERTLRNLREMAGKTQPQLATQIGVSSGLLAAIERGHAGLSTRVAAGLAAALDVPAAEVELAYQRGRIRPVT